MTRRITLAILLTVWVMLIASGITAYLTTREVLLTDLDDTLAAQAAALPELVRAGSVPSPAPAARAAAAGPTRGAASEGDRYVIQMANDGRTLRRPPNGAAGGASGNPGAPGEPRVIGKSFSTLADGRRVRAITLQALARPSEPGGAALPVVVTYTRSAEAFHHLLDRLALTLAAGCAAGGLLAAAIAYRVSQVSLRPLRKTAELVGAIDERQLDRRIPVDSLPVELLPVAARINEMLSRLEQAFAQRRQFLADASHELRTPVAALVTGLEVTLARPRQAESYRSALTGALADASQLRALVERLMEQVRSETFTHDEKTKPVDVSALIDECAASAAALGREKGVEVRKDYPAGLTLRTQPGRLRSVVSNVLSNAVEYNRAGMVEVKAACNGHGLELSVRDTGPGISPEALPHLFEPFFRGDASHQSDAGHLGLGLFLVKSHLHALNGRCTVDSEPGVGSIFRLRVPEDGEVAVNADSEIAVSRKVGAQADRL